MDKEQQKFAEFLSSWTEDPCKAKPVLIRFHDHLLSHEGVELSFRCRPGVSYSIRARGKGQKERDLFVLVDVVDDDPHNRWLSVCFYADMVTDPEDRGDWVPGGLNGEDAICFNYDEESQDMESYISCRLHEGAGAASSAGAK